MLYIYNKQTAENLLFKNCKYTNGIIFWFIALSIVFIIIHLFIIIEGSGLFIYTTTDKLHCFRETHILPPFIHIIVLGLLFAVFLKFNCWARQYDIDTDIFNSMEYSVTNEYTINLCAMSDTHTTSGNIRGTMYYVSGSIHDNYEIYYSYYDADGNLVIDHFTYDKTKCTIVPEENCKVPRIAFTEFSKSYKDHFSSYQKQCIYIPKEEVYTGLILDMQ